MAKTKDTNDSQSLEDLLEGVAESTDVTDPTMLKTSRGRGPSREIQAIRNQLLDARDKNVAKALVLNDPEKKDSVAQRIRSAGNQENMKVSTIWKSDTNTLIYGPREVIDNLRQAAKAS